MGVSLIHNEPWFIGCDRCKGTGRGAWHDDTGYCCRDCEGASAIAIDLSVYVTLAHNIACLSGFHPTLPSVVLG